MGKEADATLKEVNDMILFSCKEKYLGCWVENCLGLRNKNQISMLLSAAES